MAFVAVALEANDSVAGWLARVMEGFAVAQDEGDGLSSRFEIAEANLFLTGQRVFLFNTAARMPALLWLTGFLGGAFGYALLGEFWLLVLALFSLLSAAVFGTPFLLFVLRWSLYKHGYRGSIKFFSAGEVVRLVGVSLLADSLEVGGIGGSE